MISRKKLGRVIWAVNAFEAPSKLQDQTIEALHTLVHGTHARIEPVYVLSPDQINLEIGSNLEIESQNHWLDYYKRAAEKQLTSQLEKAKRLPLMKHSKVLTQEASGISDSVRSLVAYAQSKSADIIVVATHARTGVPRLFLGSFTETLLRHSSIPIFVVNPQTRPHVQTYDHILFATDFSEEARSIFERVIRIAIILKARLTIFHVIPHPLEPFVASGAFLLGGVWQPVPSILDEEKNERLEKAHSWADEACKLGVQTFVQVNSGGASISHAVLRFAEQRHVKLIAIGTEKSTAAPFLVENVTRQIVRHAKCPICVVHHQ